MQAHGNIVCVQDGSEDDVNILEEFVVWVSSANDTMDKMDIDPSPGTAKPKSGKAKEASMVTPAKQSIAKGPNSSAKSAGKPKSKSGDADLPGPRVTIDDLHRKVRGADGLSFVGLAVAVTILCGAGQRAACGCILLAAARGRVQRAAVWPVVRGRRRARQSALQHSQDQVRRHAKRCLVE